MNTLRPDDLFRTRNPLKELLDLERRLTGMLGTRETTDHGGMEALRVAQWSPLVDITEDDKEYLIKAELPGMKKEDMRLTVENAILAISGEQTFEKEEQGQKYHRIERAYGSFVRRFSLSEDADGSRVSADYTDGMLQVHLPKSQKAKPTAIEITVTYCVCSD